VSTLDVVAEVLREVAPRALKAREIAARTAGRLLSTSKTPATVISRDLALDLRDRKEQSRFLRVDRGAFVLKEALPLAFYSDNDPYAAQWSRNLVAAGEIAAGVVDERSIRDLKPADVASYRQCHFFTGISVWARALREAGWPDDVNVWSGSCPCQGWSSAGKRRGFDDERHLWPEWFRLIKACRPSVFLTEQVASKDGRSWLDALFSDMEGAGYTCQAYDLPACGFGAPHKRQRLFIVAYARERGREILCAPWLHALRQRWDDAARCGEADSSSAVSDATGARSCESQDGRADHGDASTCSEADNWRTAGDLEPQRGSDLDEAVGLVDASLARGWRDARTVSRAQGAGEGERIEARDLVDEPVTPGADDRGSVAEQWESLPLVGFDVDVDEGAHEDGDTLGLVRGATDSAVDVQFRPGDRIRLDGDPTWGGAVRGYWAADVEWIFCRPEPGHQDGRWRPVKSGLEPLAHRTSTELGRTRTQRLRCFGNAIVLSVARAFVEEVIGALVDDVRNGVADQMETAPVVRQPAVKRQKQLKINGLDQPFIENSSTPIEDRTGL
jgi:DNA (cytosine-5)-methyltransferase 1